MNWSLVTGLAVVGALAQEEPVPDSTGEGWLWALGVVGGILLVGLAFLLGGQKRSGGKSKLVGYLALLLWALGGVAAYLATWTSLAFVGAQYPIFYAFYFFAGAHVIAALPMLCPPRWQGRVWGSLTIGLWVVLCMAGLVLAALLLAGVNDAAFPNNTSETWTNLARSAVSSASRDRPVALDRQTLEEIRYKLYRVAITSLTLSVWAFITLVGLVIRTLAEDDWDACTVPQWLGERGADLLGESANFIAVFAGVGGYYIFGSYGDGWRRIALAGGSLALVMGVWSHILWLKGEGDLFDGVKALVSELIGILTLLSIVVPDGAAQGLIEDGGVYSGILLGVAAVVLLIWALVILAQIRSHEIRQGWLLSLLSGLVLLVLGIVAAFVFSGASDSNWQRAGRMLGILGAVFGILVEAVDSFPYVQELMSVPLSQRRALQGSQLQKYLDWEKSIWVILGTLLTIVDLVLTWPIWIPDPNDLTKQAEAVLSGLNATGIVHTAIFLAAATMAGLGTLRGLTNIVFRATSEAAPRPIVLVALEALRASSQPLGGIRRPRTVLPAPPRDRQVPPSSMTT